MNYQFTGLTPVRDSAGNVTGFKVNFTGSDSNQNYLSGTIQITTAQFTATAGDVAQINALIGPAVQTLVGTTAAG